jgi:hypothetical protein
VALALSNMALGLLQVLQQNGSVHIARTKAGASGSGPNPRQEEKRYCPAHTDCFPPPD